MDNHPQTKNRIKKLNDVLPGAVGAVSRPPPGETTSQHKTKGKYYVYEAQCSSSNEQQTKRTMQEKAADDLICHD